MCAEATETKEAQAYRLLLMSRVPFKAGLVTTEVTGALEVTA